MIELNELGLPFDIRSIKLCIFVMQGIPYACFMDFFLLQINQNNFDTP